MKPRSLTSCRARCCARACCAWRRLSTCCSSSPMRVACDAISTRILVEELIAFYGEFAGGHPVKLPPPHSSPCRGAGESATAAARSRKSSSNIGLNASRTRPHCWICPRTARGPRIKATPAPASILCCRKDSADAMENLSRQEECAPFMVLLAAFQTLLSRYTGTTDIVVGSKVSIRHRARAGRDDWEIR